MTAPLRILTFTTLFPNPARPSHGIFVANRLEKLLQTGAAEAQVIAPVPWRPSFYDHPQLGRLSRIPHRTEVRGITVHHPRYGLIPKYGMTLAPFALYRAGLRQIRTLLRQGERFDLIDAHYFYPDGVAAQWLAETFGLPLVITGRGSDLNDIPRFRTARRMIRQAAFRADGLITVCAALKEELVRLDVEAARVTVLRNGVDLKRFRPLDRAAMRRELGLNRRTLLSVGLLIERKGHHHAIAALPQLPDTDLLIAGAGPELDSLKRLAGRHGVSGRVRFLGNLDSERLCQVYNAADALVLASSREGWANVLLEAMACGTPVVASSVWGTPEVVAAPAAGRLMLELSPRGVAEAVTQLFAELPSREETRCYAEQFDWDATSRGQIDLFRRLVAARSPRSAEQFEIALQH